MENYLYKSGGFSIAKIKQRQLRNDERFSRQTMDYDREWIKGIYGKPTAECIRYVKINQL